MKRLFSIVPKDETKGEVTEGIVVVFQASDVGCGGVKC
jgi:hypothetical protein